MILIVIYPLVVRSTKHGEIFKIKDFDRIILFKFFIFTFSFILVIHFVFFE